MIYTETWFKRYGALSDDQRKLLEMLEHGFIDPQGFAERWMRFQAEPKGRWLEVDEDGHHVRMTTEWMQVHKGEILEMRLLIRDLNSGIRYLRDQDRREAETLLESLHGWMKMLEPGKIISLKGPTHEEWLNERFKHVLSEAREVNRKIHVLRLEAERARDQP